MEKNIKKLKIIFSILISIYLLLMLKILSISANEKLKEKANNQQSFKIKLTDRRANFFDRNLIQLTNKENCDKAMIFMEDLNEKTLNSLGVKIDKNKLEKLKKEKKPAIFQISKKNNNKNIIYYQDKKRYSSLKNTPSHILGYINKDNVGVCGLERQLNDFLNKNKAKIEIEFKTNRNGEILNKNAYNLKSTGNPTDGVVLTIDNNLQYVLNEYLNENIDSGAGLILNSKTGEILAIASVPDFSPDSIAKDLKNEKKPLINRALQKSPVGSIFKIVTAAAALENNLGNYSYRCDGFFKFSDTKYGCHNKKGHSTMDLKNAMKNSCNPYFISLGLKLQQNKIIDMANRMGFSRKIELAPNLFYDKATLPEIDCSKGELCNLSFGQGKLQASMLHIAQMLSVICNDGVGVAPQIIKGYIKNNNFSNEFKPVEFFCFKKEIADSLKEILNYSIQNTKADSSFTQVCGKSSTAQTGQFKSNKEILNTWFCSFSPKEKPEYILVLFKENGKFGMEDLGHLIKKINDFLFLNND